MPRLFIVTPTHSLQGGVERIIEALAVDLPARGFEVVFGLAKGSRFNDPEKFRAAFPAIRGVDVDGASGTAYGRRRALRRATLDVDPDVVLSARVFDVYPVGCELKQRGHRLRVAAMIQGYEPEYFIDLKRFAGSIDVCNVSGAYMVDEVERLTPFPRERTYAIAGGVLPARRFVEHDARAPLRVGYVGRLEETQKRAFDLVPFVHELRRRGIAFTLDIAGDGPLAPALREQISDARFHGWVSTDELYERIYPELDVLVHFAAWEGIAIAPREAMAHGVVVVVSQFRGHQGAMTFPIGDIVAAADAVQQLDRDRELLERLSRDARESHAGSDAEAADAWAAMFRDALASPQRAGPCPPLPVDSGLLSRLHVPPGVAEVVRRARRLEHATPGAEWPHWSGITDEELTAAFARPR